MKKKQICVWVLVLLMSFAQTVWAAEQIPAAEAVLSSAKVSVASRAGNANVCINGKAECTLWQTGTAETGFSSSVFAYDAYVCADVQAVKFTVGEKNAAGEAVCSMDGGTWESADALEYVPMQGDTVTVSVKPCADASAVYTFHITQVCADAVQIQTLEFGAGADACTPGFRPDLSVMAALAAHDADSVDVTFTAVHGMQVYMADNANALRETALPQDGKLTPQGRTADGNDLYIVTVQTPLTAQFNQVMKALAVCGVDAKGRELRCTYSLYLFKVGTTDGVLYGIPDAVTGYLCPASQYTSGGNTLWGMYGLFPEKTLTSAGNWNSCVSLGGFGGSITYYYEEPIVDDPRNPYGIDFTVFGNANTGASFSEPGEVSVSEDGKVWYTLAGSEHYDENAEWNYTVTYKKSASGGTCTYEDCFGNSGALANGFAPYAFPEASLYPLHTMDGDTLTVSGTRLYGANGKHADGAENGGNALYPRWGYADVHSNSAAAAGTGEDVHLLLTPVGNPYAEAYSGCGDGFDLQWAVDENGLPVDAAGLKVHYVRVQTCSFIYAGILGEKSTEVNAVVRTKPLEEAVGITDAPLTVKVGERELVLHSDKKVYTVPMDGSFTVSVSAPADANVYINNARTTQRTYAQTPDKGIVRIVVQRGTQAPAIYTLVAGSSEAHTHVPAVRTDCEMSTCSKAGYTGHMEYCTVCDILLRRTQTPLPLAMHTEGEEEIETQPTCRQEGSAVYRCTQCGEVLRTQVLPPVSHRFEKGRCVLCGKTRVVIELFRLLEKISEWFKNFLRLFH